MSGDAGKGDKPRPYSIPLADYGNNHDRIFGKKEEKKRVNPHHIDFDPVEVPKPESILEKVKKLSDTYRKYLTRETKEARFDRWKR